MLEVTTGDLLDAETEAIVNTVNCVGVMGKGIALQFKQKFPENFKDYKRACDAGELTPGRMHVFRTGELTNPKYIVNFPTKQHWRGKSKLEDIKAGLAALRSEIERLGIRSIAIPPLGCGNGGLDWSEVYPQIEQALAILPDSVSVVVFAPGRTPAVREMKVRTPRPEMTIARALFVKLIEAYAEPGYSLSLLEIQKLAYFLQEAGQPLRLNYVKHYYGPYAENLNHVLQRIEGHFIRGYGDRSQDAAITLEPSAAQEADDFLTTQAEAKERIERVSDLIAGFETPYGMELLASVHWVATKDDPRAGDAVAAIESICRWSPRKCRLFEPAHVRVAWERLQSKAMLPYD
jgi:O-acetyl-ADP-ribose deacetylase (regulator of RNase III)